MFDESLTFCEIKFGHKNTPTPKPSSPGIIMQYFQKKNILLGAQNVRVWFKHKTIVVSCALS